MSILYISVSTGFVRVRFIINSATICNHRTRRRRNVVALHEQYSMMKSVLILTSLLLRWSITKITLQRARFFSASFLAYGMLKHKAQVTSEICGCYQVLINPTVRRYHPCFCFDNAKFQHKLVMFVTRDAPCPVL